MTPAITTPLPGTVSDPMYPESDGRPVGETDYHYNALHWLKDALQHFFARRTDVYVGSNLNFYYEHGDPRKRRDPDILVAKGVVGSHNRLSYRLWEEGVLPCTLFEVASKKTWRTDLNVKPDLYARIGIPEYFIFDPQGIFVKPRLRGFRSENGQAVELTPTADGSLRSEQLGLRLQTEAEMLRLIDARTGRRVLTAAEREEKQRRRADKLAEEAENERRRADELAAELKQLRASQRQKRPEDV